MLHEHIASQIYSNFAFTPTFGQKKIIEKLSCWLSDSPYDNIFILNGYAGTGKTTLISALVKTLASMKIKPVLLAPTGRAAKVMGRYTNYPSYTIHKKIYRQKSLSDLDSSFSLDYNREKDACFIIDEASMLSDRSSYDQMAFGTGSLLEDLITYVRGGKRCRIMFVGDNAQLPPIGHEFSPALDPKIMRRYGEVEYGSMDDVVRQDADSGILFNATLVRCMLESGIYEPPLFETTYPDVSAIDGGEFLEAVEDCYARYGKDETIIITRSNKRAGKFNEGVRRNVLYAEEELESGDMLMVVKNNYFYGSKNEGRTLDSQPGPSIPVSPPNPLTHSPGDPAAAAPATAMEFIANGDIARLTRLRRVEELYGFRFAQAKLEFPDYGDTEIECKILLDTLQSETPSLTRDQNRELFHAVAEDYADIKSKAKRYKSVIDNAHFNAIQVKFAYAVTCHKAQGGQWKAVFIDRMLFGEERMNHDLMRWLYTAITRATERVYFVNFDERFFAG